MNERIKLLAAHAGMSHDQYGMFFANDKHTEDGVDLEKFAQLIVEQCFRAAMIEARGHMHPLELRRRMNTMTGINNEN